MKCLYETSNKKSICKIKNKEYCSKVSKEQGYTSCVYIIKDYRSVKK